MKVAINGFGRIGRLVLRAILEQGRSDIAAASPRWCGTRGEGFADLVDGFAEAEAESAWGVLSDHEHSFRGGADT